jgi:hypothetical protein
MIGGAVAIKDLKRKALRIAMLPLAWIAINGSAGDPPADLE